MHRMIPHDEPLPRCSNGHAARHIVDQRGPTRGGGHFIECACRHTQRFPEFDQALGNWRQVNGFTTTSTRPRVLPLRAVGRAGGHTP